MQDGLAVTLVLVIRGGLDIIVKFRLILLGMTRLRRIGYESIASVELKCIWRFL